MNDKSSSEPDQATSNSLAKPRPNDVEVVDQPPEPSDNRNVMVAMADAERARAESEAQIVREQAKAEIAITQAQLDHSKQVYLPIRLETEKTDRLKLILTAIGFLVVFAGGVLMIMTGHREAGILVLTAVTTGGLGFYGGYGYGFKKGASPNNELELGSSSSREIDHDR